MMAPGMPGMPMMPPAGMMATPSGSPLSRLSAFAGVYIEQEHENIEVLPCCCEVENVYHVWGLNADGTQSQTKLFIVKERSANWLFRNCCQGFCRPYELDFFPAESETTKSLLVERPFACTICCLNRPEANVFATPPSGLSKIGKIRNPCFVCNPNFEISDANNYMKSDVFVSCLQLGCICGSLPCEPCQKVDMDIKSVTGEKVSSIQKVQPDIVKAIISTADNYIVRFPQSADENDRALLVASTIFADYTLWERWSIRDSFKNNILATISNCIQMRLMTPSYPTSITINTTGY